MYFVYYIVQNFKMNETTETFQVQVVESAVDLLCLMSNKCRRCEK